MKLCFFLYYLCGEIFEDRKISDEKFKNEF